MGYHSSIVSTKFDHVVKRLEDYIKMNPNREKKVRVVKKDQRTASLEEYIKNPPLPSKAQLWLETWKQLTD